MKWQPSFEMWFVTVVDVGDLTGHADSTSRLGLIEAGRSSQLPNPLPVHAPTPTIPLSIHSRLLSVMSLSKKSLNESTLR